MSSWVSHGYTGMALPLLDKQVTDFILTGRILHMVHKAPKQFSPYLSVDGHGHQTTESVVGISGGWMNANQTREG